MEVKVPDIGDFADVPVIEIHVKAGDSVEKEAPLVTLESDKATMDVPSPEAGTVTAVLVEMNDRVSEGTAIVELETEGGEPDPAKEDSAPAPAETASPPIRARRTTRRCSLLARGLGGIPPLSGRRILG